MRPVVEACTGYVSVIESEAERPHEMKRHPQPYAEPAYRTRIMWNLGAKKDD